MRMSRNRTQILRKKDLTSIFLKGYIIYYECGHTTSTGMDEVMATRHIGRICLYYIFPAISHFANAITAIYGKIAEISDRIYLIK